MKVKTKHHYYFEKKGNSLGRRAVNIPYDVKKLLSVYTADIETFIFLTNVLTTN